jgi:hypothetical protein
MILLLKCNFVYPVLHYLVDRIGTLDVLLISYFLIEVIIRMSLYESLLNLWIACISDSNAIRPHGGRTVGSVNAMPTSRNHSIASRIEAI